MTTDSKKHDTTTVEQTQEEKKAAFLKKAAENKANFDLHKKLIEENLENWNGLKKANGMYLLKGRPKFTRMDMSPVSIMRGVVLFAYGEQNCQALKNCQLNGYYVGL